MAEVSSPTRHESAQAQSEDAPISKKRGPEDNVNENEAASPENSHDSGRGSKRRKASQSQKSQDGQQVTADEPLTAASSRRASDISGVLTVSSDDSVQEEEEEEEQREGVDAADAEPATFVRNDLQFKVPRYTPGPAEPLGGIAWIRDFVTLNVDLAPNITTSLMADAFDDHCGALKLARKRRRASRQEFAHAMKVVPLDELDERNIERKLRVSYFKRSKRDASTSRGSGPPSEAQDATQGAAETPQHTTAPVAGGQQPSKDAVPAVSNSTGTSSQNEKQSSAVASTDANDAGQPHQQKPSAAAKCSLCNSHEHAKDDCEKLWRTYDPSEGPIQKVNHIVAFCAMCGAEGHYFAECRLQYPGFSATSTWSMANRALYLDPDCGNEAIEKPSTRSRPGTSGGLPPPRRSLSGRSIAPVTHVRFSESDSEGEFLTQPVRRNTTNAVESIRIASNLSLPARPTAQASSTGGSTLAARVTGGPASLPERPIARAETWGGGRNRNNDGGRPGGGGGGGRGRGGGYRGGRFRGGRR